MLWQPPDGRRHSVVARIYILNGERRAGAGGHGRGRRPGYPFPNRTDGRTTPNVQSFVLLATAFTAPAPLHLQPAKSHAVRRHGQVLRRGEVGRRTESPNGASVVHSGQFFFPRRPESRSSFAVIGSVRGVCLVPAPHLRPHHAVICLRQSPPSLRCRSIIPIPNDRSS